MAQSTSPDLALEGATIGDLQARLRAAELTSAAIVEWYLSRIAGLDRQGPALNSVMEINPDAPEVAESLDVERRAGRVRGILHGIPILLKDNIETADRMQTTAGSIALLGEPVGRDAFLVGRLRDAGAVILGKANLSEWANFRSPHSISGWSSRGGQTKNPYALDRNPCGSSSGSAVAVAADLCAGAFGTETDGSIICPSQANGIVGIKPTVGLISRSGVIPIAHSQDTAGPMARCVADAAALLGAVTGADRADPATRGSAGRALRDYTAFLDPDGLRGARLGVARDSFGGDARIDKIMERALETMKKAGAELVDVRLPDEDRYGHAELQVLLFEFKADLNAYLASRPTPGRVRSLDELIAFNEKHRARVMPYFGQERLELAAKKGPFSSKVYRQAKEKCRRMTRTEGIDAVIRRHRLDAIVAPAGGPAWEIDLVNGDHHRGLGCTSPAAVAGYPSITVPAGHIFGLPVGLVFFTRAWGEGVLIRLAYAFEHASRIRRPPRFLPLADLGLPAWE